MIVAGGGKTGRGRPVCRPEKLPSTGEHSVQCSNIVYTLCTDMVYSFCYIQGIQNRKVVFICLGQKGL